METKDSFHSISAAKDKPIARIGIVVRDAVRTARQYARIFVGPWTFFDNIPANLMLHGKPIREGQCCVRQALAKLGGLNIELLQPLYGPSSPMEFLKVHGEGVHHLSFGEVEDHDTFVSTLQTHGYDIQMAGLSNGLIPITQVATQDSLGTIYEVAHAVSSELVGRHKPWGTYVPENPGLINMKGKRLAQVGIVVDDVELAARQYWEVLGIGPWNLYDIRPPLGTYDCLHGVAMNEDIDCSVKIAVATHHGFDFELLEPVYGATTHMEFLKSHGQGVHHLSFGEVDDHDEMISIFKGRGMDIEGSGVISGNMRWTYIESQNSLGTIFEWLKMYPEPVDATASPFTPYETYPSEHVSDSRNS